MSKTNRERLAVIETDIKSMKENIEFIREHMVPKSTISLLKWASGGIASLALTALLLAAKQLN